MNTNKTIGKIIEALKLDRDSIVEIYQLVRYPIELDHIDRWSLSSNSREFISCSYEELGNFLDGLIILKRGPNPNKSGNDEVISLTNNLILKKLRIALNLKEPEIEIIFSLGEVNLTKQQLSSLFRKENNKNFKECSDELLMAFLDGVSEFYYIGEE